MKRRVFKYILKKNGETRCKSCGMVCQGFKDPTGRILCWDCYKRIWGQTP